MENEDFHWIHLEHISNRKNIWYVGFGHLYSYHFLQSTYPTLSLDEWDISSNISNKINVGQNYPNPFNPITNIKYELYKEEFVSITIYDMLGNEVKNLVSANQSPGFKSIQWNSINNQEEPVSTGVYLYSIEVGNFRQTKKMILLK